MGQGTWGMCKDVQSNACVRMMFSTKWFQIWYYPLFNAQQTVFFPLKYPAATVIYLEQMSGIHIKMFQEPWRHHVTSQYSGQPAGGAISANRSLFVTGIGRLLGKDGSFLLCVGIYSSPRGDLKTFFRGYTDLHRILRVIQTVKAENMEKSGSIDSLGSKRSSSRQPSVDSLTR